VAHITDVAKSSQAAVPTARKRKYGTVPVPTCSRAPKMNTRTKSGMRGRRKIHATPSTVFR
jgi:hypothetical protein